MARPGRPRHQTQAWKRLRRRVLDRDGWRCTVCGKAGRLECHHVRPVVEGGAEMDPGNLSVVCRACHVAMHRHETPERAAWRAWLARPSD